ncbi:hypothetical protein IX336_000230 [Porphyromonas levii]|uniref:DNA-processing protein DprA n=1 Tax=Porphyromonas levii TaxID=28114 RepID=UPI001BA79166|nr:DNA-processing protein DprA [Porphyromonas levii]MBR8764877.1 hypothetical protein [Porphyromonas levii]
MSTGLKTELLVTALRLKGFGQKSVLKIANEAKDIETPEGLFKHISSFNEKKCREITLSEILCEYKNAQALIEKSRKDGIGIIGYYDEVFPDVLHKCVDAKGKTDPPLILYYRGDLETLKYHGLAMIGTREPTPNGVKAGEYFAGVFAKHDFNIVSGLAVGCDTSAHKGALAVGGKTTAFLAHGLNWDAIYPKENLDLAKQIVDSGGLLLSEYSIEESINRYQLVARDRLQAGLSNGTIVIQTGIKGGTMHAVNATIMAKKPLYAIDYSTQEDLTNEKVQGNLMLFNNRSAIRLNSKNVNDIIDLLLADHKDSKKTLQQPTLFDSHE